ncbi:MAG: hypothetical protein IKI29_00240 [Clostridia bacterium]|nr:hypothetical protein [Clostridia bacterium]
MKKTRYSVVHVFTEQREEQRKQKINAAIRKLCILEMEQAGGSGIFYDSCFDPAKEENSPC